MTRYCDKPENTPLLPDGSPLGGGPWVLAEKGKPDQAYHSESNNGVLAVCTAADPHRLDTDYVVHIAPLSGLNSKLVHQAKFAHGLGVPYSNGESPVNEDIAAFKKQTYAMRQVENTNGHDGLIVNLSDVTGLAYKRSGDGPVHKVDAVGDGKKIGCCNLSPTGVFAYVDGNGHTHATGKHGQEMLERFTALGIPRNTELEVPFARGEIPHGAECPTHSERVLRMIRDFQAAPAYQQKLAAWQRQEAEVTVAATEDAGPGGWVGIVGVQPGGRTHSEFAATGKDLGWGAKL